MTLATMTVKGQITIPAGTRSKLGLVAGSKVDFVENDAGEVVLRPLGGDIRRLRGIVKYGGSPKSLADLDRATGDAVVEQFRRSVT